MTSYTRLLLISKHCAELWRLPACHSQRRLYPRTSHSHCIGRQAGRFQCIGALRDSSSYHLLLLDRGFERYWHHCHCCVLWGLFGGHGIRDPNVSGNADLAGSQENWTRLGMGFAVAGVALLIGNPISGAILGSSSFTWAWVFSGLAMSVGALVLLLILILQRRQKS